MKPLRQGLFPPSPPSPPGLPRPLSCALAALLGLGLATATQAATGQDGDQTVAGEGAPPEQAAPNTSRERERVPEEIVVTGRDIGRLRQLVDEAEDQMYALFNELNEDDFYDIHCRRIAETGTKLKTKQCRPAFLLDAERQEALGFLNGNSYTPPASVLGHHIPILEDKMKELVREHPAFFDAVVEHHHLREVLEESRRMFHDE